MSNNDFINSIVEAAMKVPSLTTVEERKLLASLAQEANKENNVIVEVGALYGGVTAVIALSAPLAQIYTIDNFSWHPDGFPVTSKSLLLANLIDLGITNVTVLEGDSGRLGKRFIYKIDFLWIDGGHSFDFVYSDLINLGASAAVIALHDYDNPAWPSIRQAVELFIRKYPEFYIETVVDMVAVLRRR